MYDTTEDPDLSEAGERIRLRFTAVLSRRFRITEWPGRDGATGITTLTDPATGDTLTVAIMDAADVSDAYTLLTCTRDGALRAHGPFDGEHRARRYAYPLSRTDPSMAISRTVALHHRDLPYLGAGQWAPLPVGMCIGVRPDTADTPAGTLVLLDVARRLLTAVGPFTRHADADAWHPPTPLPDGVQRLYVALRPADPTLTDA